MKRAFHDITNITRKNIKLTIHKSSHRKKLIRWLYEVVFDFEYSQVTFGTSLYILDFYTQNKGFDLSEYQLIGITALFLSAKIDEKKCKSITEYIEVTDNSVTKEEILEKEIDMLQLLNFDLNICLPHHYLKIWYLEKMSTKFTLLQRRELLFSSFAYIIEKNTCKHNMYWIYLEGIRETEKMLSGLGISNDLKFYIENNRLIRNVLIDINRGLN